MPERKGARQHGERIEGLVPGRRVKSAIQIYDLNALVKNVVIVIADN